MAVRCNLKGGFRLKLPGDKGAEKTLLAYGLNDVSSDAVRDGLSLLDERMAAALLAAKKHGRPADIELDVGASEDEAPEADDSKDMSAAEKIELVKLAESHEDLRDLAEGEERKTVLAAIAKRAEDLEAGGAE